MVYGMLAIAMESSAACDKRELVTNWGFRKIPERHFENDDGSAPWPLLPAYLTMENRKLKTPAM